MSTRTLTAAERRPLDPAHLLGISLAVYTISLALYRGMSQDSPMSIHTTTGASHVIAITFTAAGVAIGLTAMAHVLIRNSLRPMLYLAAYITVFATLALFRVEHSLATNLFNALRFLSIAAVATSAWLYQHREAHRAHQ